VKYIPFLGSLGLNEGLLIITGKEKSSVPTRGKLQNNLGIEELNSFRYI